MSEISRLGRHAATVPPTIASRANQSIIDRLTQRMTSVRRPGYLYVVHGKDFSLSETAPPAPFMRLAVSESGNISQLLTSRSAQNILIARGYNSVFYISEVKTEGNVPEKDAEYMKAQVVFQVNTNIVSFIVEDLKTPRLITRSENSAFCDQILNWARSSDPHGEIVKERSDGVLLKEMAPSDLKQLEAHFTELQLSHLKKRPPSLGTSFAETSLPVSGRPWGETAMGRNIMEIFQLVSASAGSARPSNLYFRVDLENGRITPVENYSEADLAFAFSSRGVIVTCLPDPLRQMMFKRKIHLSQPQIANIWVAGAVLRDAARTAFFVRTAQMLNRQLCVNHIQSELSRTESVSLFPDRTPLLDPLLITKIEVGSLGR